MDNPTVRFLRLPHCVGIPTYATEGSAGFDLPASIKESITLKGGNRILIPTGLIIEIPQNYEGQLRARSGLASQFGITLLNGIGTIDSDYRGEVKVLLVNLSNEPYEIKPSQKIAQLVIAPVCKAILEEVSQIDQSTKRRDGGFGSTGS